MAVRSKRLAVATPGAASTVLYTCPAGETAILKTATLYNSGAAQFSVALAIRPSGSSTDYWVVQEIVPNAVLKRVQDLWLILHPGDQLRSAASGGTWVISLHGTELEGVAD